MQLPSRAITASGLIGLGLAVAGVAMGAEALVAPEPTGHSLVRLNGTDARVAVYSRNGLPMRLYGQAFSHGATAEASAETFVEDNRDFLGVGMRPPYRPVWSRGLLCRGVSDTLHENM